MLSEKVLDEELYERALSVNDEEAFRIMFERYREALTCFIAKLIRNEDDAEELMMDCFAIVLSGKNRYKGKGGASFRTWLFSVARKQTLMFLRKNYRRLTQDTASFEETELHDADNTPESRYLKDEHIKALYRAIDSLDTDQKTVLYLTYFEEMNAGDIAAVMKKNIKQIYNLTARAKGRLKGLLEEEGFR